jgi:hypothetical protein
MSRSRVYKEESLAVMARFFQTVDVLVASGAIRGLQTYCRLCDIDKRHFYAQRKNNGRGYFEVAWLLPLFRDFNVSTDWLLFGRGLMFRKTEGKPTERAAEK